MKWFLGVPYESRGLVLRHSAWCGIPVKVNVDSARKAERRSERSEDSTVIGGNRVGSRMREGTG